MKKETIKTKETSGLYGNIEFCFGQYIRFERSDGAWFGALDTDIKSERNKVLKLRNWLNKMLKAGVPKRAHK